MRFDNANQILFVDINFILFLNAIICCSHEIIAHPALMRLNLNVNEEHIKCCMSVMSEARYQKFDILILDCS